MNIIERNDSGVVLQLSWQELYILHGSMRGALEALEDWEFEIRMGVSKQETRELLNQVSEIEPWS